MHPRFLQPHTGYLAHRTSAEPGLSSTDRRNSLFARDRPCSGRRRLNPYKDGLAAAKRDRWLR